MDAALVTAVAALLAAPLTFAAAVYGARGSARAQREGGVINGFNSLTDQIQEERADLRQQVSDLRIQVNGLGTELTMERLAKATAEAEVARLRLIVAQLGGTP